MGPNNLQYRSGVPTERFRPVGDCGLTSLARFFDASGDSSEAAASSEAEDSALGNSSSTEYFSLPAFFITFRETIEVRLAAGAAAAGAAHTHVVCW